jgi:glycosyltransferase involved in cell wall biosynthesis
LGSDYLRAMARGTHGSGAPRRWLIIAATSRSAAMAYASREGLEVAAIADRFDLVAARGRLGRIASRHDATAVVVHSVDWSREEMPQLYSLALAASPGIPRHLADESSGEGPRLLGSARLLRDAAAVAPQVMAGAGRAAIELAGSPLRNGLTRRRPSRGGGEPRTVLAHWPGTINASVGGSVTHVAGILGGFASLGLEIVVVTGAELPSQLAAVADRVSVLPAAPASGRLTREGAVLLANAPLRRAFMSELAALETPIVYSRHRAMLTAPVEAASRAGVGSVLEWNGSERWAVEQWTRSPALLKRLSLPLIGRLERAAVRRASLVAAVSDAAADMALGAGADPAGVMVSPNAVSLAAIDAAIPPMDERDGGSRPRPARIGWIGSFGVWHGVDVLIRAVAAADGSPELLMIGDGVERAACERLAEELGISGRVRFSGGLPHERAIAKLAGCDILASPTAPLTGGEPYFGSPTKVFEYMALGRPIIASSLGQIEDVLEHGRTALLVKPGDVGELAAAIGELVADPDRAATLARAARREAEARHDWSQRASAIIAALGAT